MESKRSMIVRVLKRLRAAVGYQELGMTRHALRCLDSLPQLGKIGPFGLVAEILRDEFMQHREEQGSAAKALEIVACMLPATARHAVELTLTACYGQANDAVRAANDKACARGAKAECQPKAAGVDDE